PAPVDGSAEGHPAAAAGKEALATKAHTRPATSFAKGYESARHPVMSSVFKVVDSYRLVALFSDLFANVGGFVCLLRGRTWTVLDGRGRSRRTPLLRSSP